MTGLAGNCAATGPLMSANSPSEKIARPLFGSRAMMRDEIILSTGFFDPFLGGYAGCIGFRVANGELVHRAH